MKYDYIIAGSGCAGLSLLYKILQDPVLQSKSILIVDKERKIKNDRTWCFWESEPGNFESIIRHDWQELIFKSDDFTRPFKLHDYKYKMIRGIDFYEFVLEYASKFKNVVFTFEEVSEMKVDRGIPKLITTKETYSAQYIFNSTSLLNPEISKKDSLLQHFMGWEIETKSPVFNNKVGTLMDFSISQEHGDTFMYVLPITEKLALIEYTLFTGEILEKQVYEAALKDYIRENITEGHYEIVDKEHGVIPMSLQKFPTHIEGKIIHVGTAGGQTKASSGYTFQFVQKHSDKIVARLRQDKSPHIKASFREKSFQWYDKILLDVILSKKMSGKDIFGLMFKKLKPEKILRFLANESKLSADISVMISLPTMKFLTSAIKQL